MKKVYTLIFLAFLFAYTVTFGQSPTSPEWNNQPQLPKLKKENAFPVIGFSVSVPLFRKYAQKRQAGKFKLPEQPALQPMHSEVWFEEAVICRGQRYEPYSSPHEKNYNNDESGNDDPRMYDDAGGGGSGGESPVEEQPKPVNKAKKFNKGDCPNGKSVFKQMWDRQQARDKEQMAFITDRGIVWLDDAGNTRISGNALSSLDYPDDKYGKNTFVIDGVTYTITAIVHTHPVHPGYGLSQNDLHVGNDFRVPIYAIADEGIWKASPGQSQELIDNNFNNAFDCQMTGSLFGI